MIIKHTQIAYLATVNSFSKNTDWFIFSQKNIGTATPYYASYRISGQNAYNVFKYTLASSNFNFSGKGVWRFTNVLAIDNNNGINSLSSAVNIKYCQENLLNLLEKLKEQLFNDDNSKLRFPSYVGQIIVSDELDTADKVKAIYGGEDWNKISGRFLVATGPNDANTSKRYGDCGYGEINVAKSMRLGGTRSVKLETKNIPGHSHVVNGMGWQELKGKTIEMKAELSGEARYGIMPVGGGASKNIASSHRSRSTSKSLFKGRTTRNQNYGDPASMKTIAELIGGYARNNPGTVSKSFTFKPKAEIKDNTGSSGAAHDNMPPYEVKYIWERTK